MAKRKDRKDRKKKKGKKGARKGLPSAVQGLLQYLGGSGANLQPSAAPIRPRATGADAGETLTRYLAAKTENLEAMRRAAMGTSNAQQIEERTLAKRAAEEADKKISMLSVGLRESDKEKKKIIKELEEQKAVLQTMGNERLFESMRGAKQEIYVRPRPSSQGSVETPWWAGMSDIAPEDIYSLKSQSEDYGMQSDVATRSEDFEGGAFQGGFAPVGAGEDVSARDIVSGGGAAAELYMKNRPLDRPVIRDPVPRTPRVKKQRPAASGGGGAAAAPEMPKAKAAQISAAELRNAIKAATGVASKKIKLPSQRTRYANIQAALGQSAGSSADIIAALKEAGVNLAET